jgi:predicted transposase/invertase (TIGR01784 family)
VKKDTISKDILKAIIKDISKYILHLEIKNLELLDNEFERIESRRADIVAKVDNKFILHLEIQNNNDYQMQYRMLRYLVDIKLIESKLAIKQYVIYIGKEKLYMQDYVKDINLDYNYTIIDMKTIDCDYFLKQDKPDALILAILCDFKQKDPRKIVKYIIDKLLEYTKDDSKAFRRYMLMLEELSINRDLENIVKEQENMLSTLTYQDLPSYDLGMEHGIEKGLERGLEKGLKQTAKKMKVEQISVEIIANITGLSIQTIEKL